MAWGAVDNFHSRLQDIVSAYTGSAGGITGTDSGAVQQFLIDGCYDVLEKIKVIDTGSVWEFCISTAFDNNNGQDFDENRDIINIPPTVGRIKEAPIDPPKETDKNQDSTSSLKYGDTVDGNRHDSQSGNSGFWPKSL